MILQGTMQDGTVIPVQVDAQGRLVAEGLPGPAGPAGPQGPEGPQGDPFALPPGAAAGDLLGWNGSALTWVRGGPVVTSHAVTDEIVAVSQTKLYQSTLESYPNPAQGIADAHSAFDYSTTSYAGPTYNAGSDHAGVRWVATSFGFMNPSVYVHVAGYNYGGSTSGYASHVYVNGALVGLVQWGQASNTYQVSGLLNTVDVRQGPGDRHNSCIAAIVVNGQMLQDTGPHRVLRFASSKGLDLLRAGDAVVQVGGGRASGVVRSVNAAASEVVLESESGTWGPVSQGKALLGPDALTVSLK